MERLRNYCLNICVIDDLQTFVISPTNYDALQKDTNLLQDLRIKDKTILRYIRETREVGTDKIYLAFVYLPVIVERFQWFPLHCYKNGNQFYHVFYRKTWMCRECKKIMNKSIIMPMVEADPTIYRRDKKYPDIPSIFQKIKCLKCGKLLQNHLIMIE